MSCFSKQQDTDPTKCSPRLFTLIFPHLNHHHLYRIAFLLFSSIQSIFFHKSLTTKENSHTFHKPTYLCFYIDFFLKKLRLALLISPGNLFHSRGSRLGIAWGTLEGFSPNELYGWVPEGEPMVFFKAGLLCVLPKRFKQKLQDPHCSSALILKEMLHPF